MSRIALLTLLACTVVTEAAGYDFSLSGYLRETPLAWKPSPYFSTSPSRRFDNLLHTRQILSWYPLASFRARLELKTRCFWGESAGEMRESIDAFSSQETYFNWDHTFIDKDHLILISEIDRAWVDWNCAAFQLTLGRQRIAWGTNLVWNPIDIFNPSSPLDFDNVEKPGMDGARLQWYIAAASKIELAVAPNREGDSTVAAILLKLNVRRYDVHLLAGRKSDEAVLGAGWAGQIGGAGFRGEGLLSLPRSDSYWQSPGVQAAFSGDYTFRSSLYLHAEVLYNSRGTTGKAGGLHLLTALSAGWLTPARWSLFAEIARDLSPLVRANLTGILNPYDLSWYLGPSLSWSAATDLDLTALGLVFGGNDGTEFGDDGEILMLRLKWSF